MSIFELIRRTIKYLEIYKGGSFKNLVIEYSRYKEWNKKLNKIDKRGDFKEYARDYSSISYLEEIVIDWGADIGSSAIYFLSKGARRVYFILFRKSNCLNSGMSLTTLNFLILLLSTS